jgi:hypothetical protein
MAGLIGVVALVLASICAPILATIRAAKISPAGAPLLHRLTGWERTNWGGICTAGCFTAVAQRSALSSLWL